MKYEAYIEGGQPVCCSFTLNPSTLLDELNAFIFRIECELSIASWKMLQDCSNNMLQMKVIIDSPFYLNFIKKVDLEGNAFMDVTDQIIRTSAFKLCQEIKKTLALQTIFSSEFRELKITKE